MPGARSEASRMTSIGSMRHKVSWQKDTGTAVDASNVRIPNFTTFATGYAEIVQIGGTENPVAMQKFAIARYRVRHWYVRGLTEGMQLLWEGRVLSIVSVNDIDGRRIQQELSCTERKAI